MVNTTEEYISTAFLEIEKPIDVLSLINTRYEWDMSDEELLELFNTDDWFYAITEVIGVDVEGYPIYSMSVPEEQAWKMLDFYVTDRDKLTQILLSNLSDRVDDIRKYGPLVDEWEAYLDALYRAKVHEVNDEAISIALDVRPVDLIALREEAEDQLPTSLVTLFGRVSPYL